MSLSLYKLAGQFINGATLKSLESGPYSNNSLNNMLAITSINASKDLNYMPVFTPKFQRVHNYCKWIYI